MSSHGGKFSSLSLNDSVALWEQESKAVKQDRGDFSIHWWRKWLFLSLLVNLKIATPMSPSSWETVRFQKESLVKSKCINLLVTIMLLFPFSFLPWVQRSALVLENGWSGNQARCDHFSRPIPTGVLALEYSPMHRQPSRVLDTWTQGRYRHLPIPNILSFI